MCSYQSLKVLSYMLQQIHSYFQDFEQIVCPLSPLQSTTCSVHPQLSTPVAVSSRCHCSPNSLHQWQSKVVVTVHPTLHTSGSQQSLSLCTQLSTPVAVSSRCHCSPNSPHQWQSAVVVTVHPTLHTSGSQQSLSLFTQLFLLSAFKYLRNIFNF
jgi:hypothetical protein